MSGTQGRDVDEQCRRCGVTHRVNYTRRKTSAHTGLCRDCFNTLRTPCPHCGQEYLLNGFNVHRRFCAAKKVAP